MHGNLACDSSTKCTFSMFLKKFTLMICTRQMDVLDPHVHILHSTGTGVKGAGVGVGSQGARVGVGSQGSGAGVGQLDNAWQ